MELALQTCLRRGGKRFIVSKLSHDRTYCNSKERSNIKKQSEAPPKNSAKPEDILKQEKTFDTYAGLASQTSHRHLCLNQTMAPNRKSLATYRYYIVKTSHFCQSSFLLPKRNLNIGPTPSCWIAPSEIEDLLVMNNLSHKKGHTCYLTVCQKCLKKGRDKELTNLVNIRTGDVICRKCGSTSHWDSFRKFLSESNESLNNDEKPLSFFREQVDPLSHHIWLNSIPVDDVILESLPDQYGCISMETFEKYDVRFFNDANLNSFVYPYFDITQLKLIGFKRVFPTSKTLQVFSSSEHLSLFGWNLIGQAEKGIILTCSEIDSLAITEALGVPALSLPYGFTLLPPELIPYLEQFDRITLWFNNEYRCRQNLHHFARKLGLSRCYVVNSSEHDSPFNVLCRLGEQKVRQIVSGSTSLSHDHIVTFKEIVDSVYNELINAKENAGVQFQRFPVLNEYLKGHRRGELTIFTGPTGSGKTTFLSELSLDLCMQGVRTLWGSFELKNPRLVNILLHQYSGLQLENHMDQFSKWSHKFQLLPFYFMTYYGSQELKQVLSTIEYAIYAYDIEHVVIDNLQFMTSVNHGEDRFLVMDKAISLFRKCASDHNVHITLVVHPRKENEGSTLQTASIYGSAKASQEADNVLILQTSENLCMQISKNRFSGSIGSIPLKFHHQSLCLSGFHRNPETDEEILPALKPKRPVQNIKVVRKHNNES